MPEVPYLVPAGTSRVGRYDTLVSPPYHRIVPHLLLSLSPSLFPSFLSPILGGYIACSLRPASHPRPNWPRGTPLFVAIDIMGLFSWASRRSGGLAMVVTIALSYWVISRESEAQRNGYHYQQPDTLSAPSSSTTGGGIWTVIFAYYCLFIHVLVSMFPLRACWAIWDLTRNLRKTARSKLLKDFRFARRRRGSSTSLSSSETLISSRDGCSASSSEAGDLDQSTYPDTDTARDQIIHAIIIPNYKEEMDTLRETLEVLASHTQARNTYDVSTPNSHFRKSRHLGQEWHSCLHCLVLVEIQLRG